MDCGVAPVHEPDDARARLQPSRPVRVTVTTLAGTAYHLASDRGDSVVSLKRQLCTACCVDTWQIRLVPCMGVHGVLEDYDSIGMSLAEDEDELRLTLVVLQLPPAQILTNTQQLAEFLCRTRPRPATTFDIYRRRAFSMLSKQRCFYQFGASHRSCLSKWPGWAGHFGSHTKAVRKQQERGTRRHQKAQQEAALSTHTARTWVAEESRKIRTYLWRPRSLDIPTELKAEVAQGRVSFSSTSHGSLLHRALSQLCGPGLLELCNALLAGGARAGVPDSAGRQPLHLACSFGRGEVALLLLRHRADAGARDRGGQTPLDCAVEHLRRLPSRRSEVSEVQSLARACWRMLHGGDTPPSLAPEEGASAAPEELLAGARRRLAAAATDLALFKPFGGQLTKDEVVSASALPRATLSGMGSELWRGWPQAFLVLGCSVDSAHVLAEHFEDGFVQARWAFLSSRAAACSSVAVPRIARSNSSSDASACSDISADADVEWPPVSEEYLQVKRFKDSKWERNARGPAQRSHRVPWHTGQGRRASRSSRLARQLPTAGSGRAFSAWKRRCGGGCNAQVGRAAVARAAWTDYRREEQQWGGY
mmetsp:Transcript_112474/g.350528  ORF Transcript_112474/g.350528 Transcript_112474/m.350528 type:complete len:592 (-) Transcript_112474:133-1908(-)